MAHFGSNKSFLPILNLATSVAVIPLSSHKISEKSLWWIQRTEQMRFLGTNWDKDDPVWTKFFSANIGLSLFFKCNDVTVCKLSCLQTYVQRHNIHKTYRQIQR